jgi:hypothetical protein
MCRTYEAFPTILREVNKTHAFHRENGTIITIGTSCVKKKYTTENRISRIRRLQNIYALLERKKPPNVDQLLIAHEDHSELGSVAFFRPRGINKCPSSAIEVMQAIHCVLEALVVWILTHLSVTICAQLVE